MENVRATLPRGHWVETRDPWSITEGDMREFRRGLPKTRQAPAATLAGTPPQLSASEGQVELDDAIELRVRRTAYAARFSIAAWGGPLLDDKPVDADTWAQLPVVLTNAITRAADDFWVVVNGQDEDENPTEPA